MRKILFRGKRIDNVKWVYGYYFYDSFYDKAYIMTGRYCMEARKRKLNQEIINAFEVNPETIRQYTGLTDKNGTKIFEGDICNFYSRYGIDTYSVVGVVVYNANATEFGIDYDSTYLGLGRHYYSKDIEVIGNIYDNPELLGGKNND